jgi:hypothetical protein
MPTRRRVLMLAFPAAVVLLAVVVWLFWLQPPSAITRENAAKIKDGMRLAEVEAILGGPARDDRTGNPGRATRVRTTRREWAPLSDHDPRSPPTPRMALRPGADLGTLRFRRARDGLHLLPDASRGRRSARHDPSLVAAVTWSRPSLDSRAHFCDNPLDAFPARIGTMARRRQLRQLLFGLAAPLKWVVALAAPAGSPVKRIPFHGGKYANKALHLRSNRRSPCGTHWIA